MATDRKTLRFVLGAYVAVQTPALGEEVRDLLSIEPPHVADTTMRPNYLRSRGAYPFIPAGDAPDFDDDGISRMSTMLLASGEANYFVSDTDSTSSTNNVADAIIRPRLL